MNDFQNISIVTNKRKNLRKIKKKKKK